jgi:DNA-binding SARP family transcriptional activator/Tfp pilus assembly protein PilF
MALLALVASAGKRGVSRERVAGVLWGEAGEENARHSLSQNLYTLRRETGCDWIQPAPKLILNGTATSDVADFLAAQAAGDFERVAALYTGPFLQDFHLTGSAEFERWADEERSVHRNTALRAIESLAQRATDDGRTADSIAWSRRLTEIDPLSGKYALGLMNVLAASGDIVAALSHARAHEDLVRRELEAEPDKAVRAVAAALRARARESTASVSASPPADFPVAASEVAPPFRRKWAVALLAVGALIAAVAWLPSGDRAAGTRARLAVGTIRSNDSAATGLILRDMLATGLGGVGGLSVISNARLLELIPPGDDSLAPAVTGAARRAGATELLEGEMTREARGYRLTLRRVAIASGSVRESYAVTAADPTSLVDSAIASMAQAFGIESPRRGLAQIRTGSPAAYALYEQGLRAYRKGEVGTANRLMRAALDNDSTFAMAAYWAWSTSVASPEVMDTALRTLAIHLASRTIERERLYITASVAGLDSSIFTTTAIAESLVARYPEAPEALLLLGRIYMGAGDYPRAVTTLERAIALDSSAATADPSCRLCDALSNLTRHYVTWDSLAAAERTARRMIRLRPGEPGGWHELAEPFLRQGRRKEVLDLLARRDTLTLARSVSRGVMLRDMIRWGELESVDAELLADLRHPSPPVRGEARWLYLISLRNQGRLREAMAFAKDGTIPGTTTKADIEPETLHQWFLPYERGEPMETWRRFRDLGERELEGPQSPGYKGRVATWHLTIAATALAAAGDTAGVRRMADLVEQNGARSNYGRDPRLHHFLRGLILQHEGNHAAAVEAFRRSVHSLPDGYTRINVEMARSLIALGRTEEAVAVLRPAVHGGVDGGNTYATHTELRETMARAFERAGQVDSARVYWRMVEKALRRADPVFATRYAHAKERSGTL